LQAAASSGQVPGALSVLRSAIGSELRAPAGLAAQLGAAAAEAGLIPSAAEWAEGSAGWDAAWEAICQVSRGYEPAG
jgi:hypothetical protein